MTLGRVEEQKMDIKTYEKMSLEESAAFWASTGNTRDKRELIAAMVARRLLEAKSIKGAVLLINIDDKDMGAIGAGFGTTSMAYTFAARNG